MFFGVYPVAIALIVCVLRPHRKLTLSVVRVSINFDDFLLSICDGLADRFLYTTLRNNMFSNLLAPCAIYNVEIISMRTTY